MVALLAAAGLSAPASGATTNLVRPHALAPAPVPAGATSIGAVPAGQTVHIEVVLAPRSPDALNALLVNLYNPSSPQYHQWLDPGAFDATFGPAPSTVDATLDWLRGLGFTASAGHGFAVDAVGSAGQIAHGLGVTFGRYRLGHGRTAFLASSTPEVPAPLATKVSDIIGLNNLPAAAPQAERASATQFARGAALPAAAAATPHAGSVCSADATEASNEHGFTTASLGAAYSVPSYTAAGDTGAGERIAVYELAPSSAADIQAFKTCLGLNNPVTVDPVDGGGTPDTGGTGEADLDIEQIATQAPGASITSYEGPNTDLGSYDVAARIVGDDSAKFVSDSWGECEPLTPSSGSDSIASFDVLLEQAASQGQAVFSADGDSGSEDCFFTNGDSSLQVDYPSSSPWITAVGGSSLSLNGGESVWNGCDGVASNSGCASGDGAGGGGTSTVEPKPFWQGAPNPPTASCGSHGANCRQTPDVAADAGVPVDFYTGGGWSGFVGTSIGAPLDTAIWADRAQECGQGSPGDAAPTLYVLALTGGYSGAINDITTGTNDVTGTHGGSFTAGPSFDLASGLGSLNAAGVGCTQAVSVTPSSAPGGSQVTVHGFGLQNATISFGGMQAQVLSANGSSAQVIVPAGSGTVSVVATGPVATAASPASFTYGSPVGLFTRIYGQTAIGTAIATSQADFPTNGSANAVVLARDDFFSDALAGGPLAAAQGGPVLITESPAESANLDPAVQAEIGRVLKPGGTVYLLGGNLALSPTIDTALQAMGFKTVRLAGNDEYATAVQIAQQLNNPSMVFEATGLNFADALSAVPAAVMQHGAILLTQGPTQNAETAAYLGQHPSDHRYAIGGPLAAAGADPGAQAVFGNDLYATSAAVAATFFPAPTTVGAATGTNFPDALSAGPSLGLAKGPLLLVQPTGPLPTSIASYLATVGAGLTSATLFGGPLAVADSVLAELDGAV